MKKVLVCLDTDPQPSVFDAVVAVDSGADVLLRHAGVRPGDVRGLVHGAIFTRGGANLKNSAVFIGGSDVEAGERLLAEVAASFFGPMRVSVLIDSNGSNTTAAAAVLEAERCVPLGPSETAVVIGGGPVGRRVATLLAESGVRVRLSMHSRERAKQVVDQIAHQGVEPWSRDSDTSAQALLAGASIVVAAGPAGVEVLSEAELKGADDVRVAIDLNATPPLGIGGIGAMDKGIKRFGQVHYGALAVGGLKMRIHRAAIAKIFEANDLVLGAREVLELGRSLGPA